MLELIKRNYWWSGIRNNVRKYVQGCQDCQQNKVQHMKKMAPLYPLSTPKTPWEEISIDVIGPPTKIRRQRRYFGSCRPILQNDQTHTHDNFNLLK